MIFSKVYITDSGYEIFGDAIISDNPLTGEIERYNVEWGDVKVSRYDLSNVDRAYINTLTASSEVFNESNLTGDGYVSGVVRTPNESTVYDPPVYTTITVSSTVTNIHYSGTARTLGIWARLNHGSGVSDEWKLVVVAAANDTDVNQGDNVIPQPGQETYSSMVDCHIRISDNYTESTIQGADSWYATASNFQKLLNRSVTKYKDGSSVSNPVGENQTIYGIKTFKDETHCDATLRTKKIVASDDITATGKTVTADTFKGTLGNSSTLCNIWASNIYFGNTTSAVPYIKKDSNNLLIAGSVVPGTNTYNIGSANVRWNTVYATTFNGTSFTGTADTATNLTNKPVVTWTNASKSGTTITDASIKVKAGEKESDAKTVVTVKQAYIPYIGNTSVSGNYPLTFTDKGNTTASFKNLYTDADNKLYYNPGSDTLTCSTVNMQNAGTSNNHISSAYVDNLYIGNGENSIANYTKPTLTFSDAVGSSSGSSLTVSNNGGSSSTTIDTVRKAYQPYVFNGGGNNAYPIVFTNMVSSGSTSATISPGFKNLYTSPSVGPGNSDLDTGLCYNTSYKTLYSKNITCNHLSALTLNLYDVILTITNTYNSRVYFGAPDELVWDSSNSCYRIRTYRYDNGSELGSSYRVKVYVRGYYLETRGNFSDAANFTTTNVDQSNIYHTYTGSFRFKFLNGNKIKVPGNDTEYIRCILYALTDLGQG